LQFVPLIEPSFPRSTFAAMPGRSRQHPGMARMVAAGARHPP